VLTNQKPQLQPHNTKANITPHNKKSRGREKRTSPPKKQGTNETETLTYLPPRRTGLLLCASSGLHGARVEARSSGGKTTPLIRTTPRKNLNHGSASGKEEGVLFTQDEKLPNTSYISGREKSVRGRRPRHPMGRRLRLRKNGCNSRNPRRLHNPLTPSGNMIGGDSECHWEGRRSASRIICKGSRGAEVRSTKETGQKSILRRLDQHNK